MKLNLESLSEGQARKVEQLIESFLIENSFPKAISHIKRGVLERFDSFSPTSYIEAKEVLEVLPISDTEDVSLNIKNPCVVSRFNCFELKLTYKTNAGRETWITIPIDGDFHRILIENNIIQVSDRSVYDSERHYFVGVSDREFASTRVRCYKFSGGNKAWYGGSMSCEDSSLVKRVIELILTQKQL